MGNLFGKNGRKRVVRDDSFGPRSAHSMRVKNYRRQTSSPGSTYQGPIKKDRAQIPNYFLQSNTSFPTLDICFQTLPELRNLKSNNQKIIFNLTETDRDKRRHTTQLSNRKNSQPKSSEVFMPYSKLIAQACIESGTSELTYWQIIISYLKNDFKSITDLEKAIHNYNKNMRQCNFNVLYEYCRLNKSNKSFMKLINDIKFIAFKLPSLFPQTIPFLNEGINGVMFLTQEQIACLLANAFFCTFPMRTHQNNNFSTFPIFNFSNLFYSKNEKDLSLKLEKLKCIFNYFSRIINAIPVGVVSFERQCLDLKKTKWRTSIKLLSNLKVESNGLIEENGRGYSEVDFANEFIGGGVLTSGIVQEEIRFLISPELIAARLFTEKLKDNEAIIITGAEQFNTCEGYSNSFQFKANYCDNSSRDRWGRHHTQIIGIDAKDFNDLKQEQYDKEFIDRELNKAFSGFMINDSYIERKPTIATGKWGCGVFNGDPHLKCLIQILAASEAGRDLIIFTYDDKDLKKDLDHFYKTVKNNSMTVGQIYCRLIDFDINKSKRNNLLNYICLYSNPLLDSNI